MRPHLFVMTSRRSFLIGTGAVTVSGLALYAGASADMGSAAAYADAMAKLRGTLGADPSAADLVRYATLAANGHNTQPWRFRLSPGRFDIAPDTTRRTPVVDPDDHHLYASLGCAAENLAIASAATGRPATVEIAPDGRVTLTQTQGSAAPTPLFAAIPRRRSTRAEYDGRPLATADLAVLETATVPGVDLVLITDDARRARLRDLVIAGNSAQMADPAFIAELKAWIRFNPRQALSHGDGLYAASSGNPSLPGPIAPMLFDLVFRTATENDKYARHVQSSAGFAVFAASGDGPAHWVAAGRAIQRFALQATALGLTTAFINMPVEVTALRPEVASLIGLPGRRPNTILRFGRGPDLPFSPRRPVRAVIDI